MLLGATARVQTRYGHLQRSSVSAGSAVVAGGQIGLVGQTGHGTGPHLHFETRVINPGATAGALANAESTPVDPQLVGGLQDPVPGAGCSATVL
jgi:murein DD-endopeptidase MepM/ murein hydrolase activator NlpD